MTLSNQQKMTLDSDFLQAKYRDHALLVVGLPFIGFIAAIGLIFYSSPSLVEVTIFLVMWALNMIGVEVGFHRHFAHSSFKANTAVRTVLAVLGMMASQGRLIYWVANHRRHHQHSDRSGDLHSPYIKDGQALGKLKGLWHSHVEWIFTHDLTNTSFFTKDLLRDPILFKLNQLYLLWIVLGLVLPAIVDGAIARTWIGVLYGFLWGGLARIFVAQQFTFAINSICHVYGNKPLVTDDYSTNNFWLAIPTFGESWHNHHHAFPNSAILGFKWWQIDPSAWVIRGLEKLGWIWEVKVPTAKMIEAKKVAVENC